MERLEVTMGDFLKNAGIVGMKYMLEVANARQNTDYGITEDEQALWVSNEFADTADWTDMYFKAFVSGFGSSTVYQAVLDKIEINQKKIKDQEWNDEKTEKEDLKFINDKLLSNSYQSGYANMKDDIENSEIYEKLKREKLSDKLDVQQLYDRLEELKNFLNQPLCRETFIMKSVIYNYINRFWDGKCFLLRANAKKDMRELFEKEFSEPLRKHWTNSHEKAKDLCIDCGLPMESKEKVSIAFMKDMADDLARKKSAFWNCKVDAFLCPVCAFVYALSPLGFQLIGNKFVFVNINESVTSLLSGNRKESKIGLEGKKQEDEKYPSWFARVMNVVLGEKIKEISNIQIVLRGINADDKYLFSVINKKTLYILQDEQIRKSLKKLAEHPIVKIDNDYLNVYEAVILNLLQYHRQYALLNKLLKASVENDGILWAASFVYNVELQTSVIKSEKGGTNFVNRYMNYKMRDSGYALRKTLLAAKGATTDECLRGTIYQLINALSVKNEEKFIEIVMRIYCSSKLLMPDGFVEMLGDTEKFQQYGYAFVLGLKGSSSENEKEKKTNE